MEIHTLQVHTVHVRCQSMTWRPQCAICDNTNATTRLCKACQKDPANADWSDGAREDPDDNMERLGYAADLLSLNQDRKPIKVTEVVQQVARLAFQGREVRTPYVDKLGRRRGDRVRFESMSIRQIAEVVGLSKSAVEKIIKRLS